MKSGHTSARNIAVVIILFLIQVGKIEKGV